MAKYYCKNCGRDFSSIRLLTGQSCSQSPLGSGKGCHELYEGSEKTKYTCKYCGNTFKSLRVLTSMNCPRHPNGSQKGHHSPAL